MLEPGLIKMFILTRPGPAYDFNGTLGGFGCFYEILGNCMIFSGIYWIFGGEMILWDRSYKNHFNGTGPVILGPVPRKRVQLCNV